MTTNSLQKMNEFEKLELALKTVREKYIQDGGDFNLTAVLREVGIPSIWVVQRLKSYGLIRRKSPSLARGWHVDTQTKLEATILFHKIQSEPESIRKKLREYIYSR